MRILSKEESIKACYGIDTISLEVCKFYVNWEKWSLYYDPTNSVKLEYKTFYDGNCRYYIHIQAEALKLNLNYQDQVIALLWQLQLRYSVFNFPDLNELLDCSMINYMYKFPNLNNEAHALIDYLSMNFKLIFELRAFDFFFDFAEKDLKMFHFPNNYPTTNYSGDHNGKSLWCCYDRRAKLKKLNQMPYNIIDSMPYPYRIEYKLRTKNCNILYWCNLNGTYHELFQRFSVTIAKSFKKYSCELASVVQTSYHLYFNYILFLCNQKHISSNEYSRQLRVKR